MKRHALGLIICFAAFGASAQQLNLFEATDGEPEVQGPVQTRGIAVQQSSGAPAFTLRGTSRFGDTYHTVLLDRGGQSVTVDWQPGQRVPVPGYENFVVTGIEGRQVTLQHPALDACIESESAGVSCLSNNLSLLALSNAAPLPLSANSSAADAGPATGPFGSNQTQSAGADPQLGIQGRPGAIINPFSGEVVDAQQLSPEQQAAIAERQGNRRGRFSQFQPERIDESDVPQGMRRVRTPFGDRLVPDN